MSSLHRLSYATPPPARSRRQRTCFARRRAMARMQRSGSPESRRGRLASLGHSQSRRRSLRPKETRSSSTVLQSLPNQARDAIAPSSLVGAILGSLNSIAQCHGSQRDNEFTAFERIAQAVAFGARSGHGPRPIRSDAWAALPSSHKQAVRRAGEARRKRAKRARRRESAPPPLPQLQQL